MTWLPFAATAALLVLVAPGWGLGPAWLGSAPAPDKLVVRYEVPLPENTGSWPRLSPDGRLFVFGSAVEGVERLWVRPLGSTMGLPVAGNDCQGESVLVARWPLSGCLREGEAEENFALR